MAARAGQATVIHVSNAPAAEALRAHAERWRQTSLATALEDEARTGLSCAAAGLRLDFSRQRLDARVLADLHALAEQAGLPQAIAGLMAGETLNVSENRAALHTALRAEAPPAAVAGDIAAARRRMRERVEAVREGRMVNAAGEPYTDVLNIGIGGSDLGPRLVCAALPAGPGDLRPHFAGNLDSAALAGQLAGLDPARTLCIVTSKSFRTQETLACARQVHAWLQQAGVDAGRSMLAVTAAPEDAAALGIPAEHCFALWPWVGGRYSLWSAVGLSIALTRGWARFTDLLVGAAAMDAHFATAPAAENLPLNWALTGLWNRNFLDYATAVTVAYSDRLAVLPAWLQQLEMESNGKRVGRDGQPLPHATAPVHWGGVGTHGQHAYFQLLHQGSDAHPVDFILPLNVEGADPALQQALLTNALAQSAALSHGRDPAAEGLEPVAAAWRHCPGNRPSSLLWLDDLAPATLGALLAACEHRCFVQGWLWGVNPFDQFGVELGKTLFSRIESALAGNAAWPDPQLRRQAELLQSRLGLDR